MKQSSDIGCTGRIALFPVLMVLAGTLAIGDWLADLSGVILVGVCLLIASIFLLSSRRARGYENYVLGSSSWVIFLVSMILGGSLWGWGVWRSFFLIAVPAYVVFAVLAAWSPRKGGSSPSDGE